MNTTLMSSRLQSQTKILSVSECTPEGQVVKAKRLTLKRLMKQVKKPNQKMVSSKTVY